MPIEFKREGNVCDNCKHGVSDVGQITHYTKFGQDRLLCKNCIDDLDKVFLEKCPKCNRPAHERSGMREYVEKGKTKKNCYECDKKRRKNIETRNIRIKFFKDNWKFWITIGLGVIALLVAKSMI